MRCSLLLALLAVPAAAQNVAIFPADYVNVAESTLESANLPLAAGVGRFLVVYESWDLPIPSGRPITHVGFREDTTRTTMNTGYALQLEIRMGYTSHDAYALSATFDANYTVGPTTVFGPAMFSLPNLRDPANPLPDHRFWIPLATPFAFDPAQGNLLVEYRIFGNANGGNSFTYYLDRATSYSPVVTGPAGCPHSGGRTPSLSLQDLTAPGTFSATCSNLGSQLAVLILTPGGQLVAPYPLAPYLPGIAPACQGQIPLAGAAPLVTITSGTTGSWTFSMPNAPLQYNDLYLACQVAYLDFFSPGGVAVSNGAQVQVGISPRSSIYLGYGHPAIITTGTTFHRYYSPVALFQYQ